MLCADGDISSHSCTSWTREQKGQKNIRRKSLRPFPSIPLASRMLPLTTILLIRLNGGKSKDAPTNNKTKYFECTCQWDVWQRHYAPELSNTDRSWKTTMPLLFYIIVYSTKGSARWEIVEGRFGNVLNICRLSTILRMIKFLGVWTCLKSVFKETWTKQQHKTTTQTTTTKRNKNSVYHVYPIILWVPMTKTKSKWTVYVTSRPSKEFTRKMLFCFYSFVNNCLKNCSAFRNERHYSRSDRWKPYIR